MIETIVKLMGRCEWKSGRYCKVVDDGVLKYYNFKPQLLAGCGNTIFGMFSSPVQKMSCNSFPPPRCCFILEIDGDKCIHGQFL